MLSLIVALYAPRLNEIRSGSAFFIGYLVVREEFPSC